ncbi:MAG: hypothetical protein ABW277_05200 [Longimicrobiaceae bacterium]
MSRETEFSNDAEALEAIRRTRAEMQPPPDLGVRAIVESATAAYWKGRELEREKELSGDPNPVRDTAGLARSVAYRLGGIRRQFVSDAVAVILPVLGGLAIGYADYTHLLSRDPSPIRPGLLAVVAIVLIGLVGVVRSVAYGARTVNRSRFWGSFVYNSSGAACASVMVAVFLSVQFFHAKKEHLDYAIDQTQQTIIRAALASIQDRENTGHYSRFALSADPVQLSTSVLTPTRAVYQASRKGLPGDLKAELDTGGAVIYWDYDKADKDHIYRIRLIVGSVAAAKDSSFLLDLDSGGSEWIWVRDPLVRIPPYGTRVITLLKRNSKSALAIEPITATVADGRKSQ